MAISAAGVGSGLDIEGIIKSLMAAERVPLNTITQQRSETNARISTYGTIKSAFAKLSTIADKLSKLSNLYPTKVTSSNETFITGTATGSNANGNYTLEVQQLAKAQSIAAPRVGSATDIVGTGSLTLTMGTYNSTGNTFTADASKTPITVNIGAG
jgi:flagellar hook-associated protein 2